MLLVFVYRAVGGKQLIARGSKSRYFTNSDHCVEVFPTKKALSAASSLFAQQLNKQECCF